MCQLLNSVDGTLSLLNKLTFYAFPTKTSEFRHPKSSLYLGNKTAKRWRFRGVRLLSLQGGSEAADHVKSSNKFKVPRNLADVPLLAGAVAGMGLVSKN